MICYQNTGSLYLPKDTVISAGKFDGMHQGHRALLLRMKKEAQDTMDTLILRISTESSEDRRHLLTENETRNILLQAGVGHDLKLPLRGDFRNMTREDFACRFIPETLRAKAVVAGRNFRFGKDALGDAEYLAYAGKKCGYRVVFPDDVYDCGEKISSTMIRGLLSSGEMERANRCLGYSYAISGTVVHGRALARHLGFPTANIVPPKEKALPRYGVYQTEVHVGPFRYQGLANIGVKPTVTSEKAPLLEVYLIGFTGDLYRRDLEVRFQRFIRPEMHFGSISELKEQMEKDLRSIEHLS